MVNEINYVNIRIIADRLMRLPLLTDLSLEAIVLYTTDFIGIVGLPSMYVDKVEELSVDTFRAKLPCDLVSIKLVKDKKSNVSLRSTTDSYYLMLGDNKSNKQDGTFKTQGSIIYTSFKEGDIIISYKAILVDSEGLPLIPDNSIFLKALELYIKAEWFSILFDMGKISPAALLNVQQLYAWRVGLLNMEFTIPSISEMEAITNIMNLLIPRTNEFRKGFKSLGNKEFWKDQR